MRRYSLFPQYTPHPFWSSTTLAVLQQNHLFLMLHFQSCRRIASSHLVLRCSWKSVQQASLYPPSYPYLQKRALPAPAHLVLTGSVRCLQQASLSPPSYPHYSPLGQNEGVGRRQSWPRVGGGRWSRADSCRLT